MSESQAGIHYHLLLIWSLTLLYPFSHQVKLAVLKYYKVDENGKITRLRRECPAESCGAGVFMASHFDRQYCGKCCLTYVFSKPQEGKDAK